MVYTWDVTTLRPFSAGSKREKMMKCLRGILANCLSGRGYGERSNLGIWREEKSAERF